MKSKHFTSPADVQAYIESELLASLRDDLNKMTFLERNYHTDDDRAELAAKIADIEEHFQRKHWSIAVTDDDDGVYCMWATDAEKSVVVNALAEKQGTDAKYVDVWETPTHPIDDMLEIIKDI